MEGLERLYLLYKGMQYYKEGNIAVFIAAIVILLILGFIVSKTGLDKLVTKVFIVSLAAFSAYIFIKGSIMLRSQEQGFGAAFVLLGGGILFTILICWILSLLSRLFKRLINKVKGQKEERDD